MRLDLDTEIRFPDGMRAGVLRNVIITEENRVESVVMSTAGLVSRTVLVPVASLSEEAGEVLTVNLTPDEIDMLPDYEEEMVPAVGEEWTLDPEPVPGSDVFPATLYDPGMMPVFEISNAPAGSTSISQGTEIWCAGDSWGVVDEVLVDDTGEIYAFVGRPDNTDEHDRVIPTGLVSEFSPHAVVLSCTLEDLPNYTQEIINEQEEPDMD